MPTVRTTPTASEAAYLDFELEIGPGQGREYPVAVLRAPSGEAHGVLHFPYDELALESRLKDLQIALLMTAEARRRLPTQEEQPVQRFGKDLFDALLTGEIRSAYDISWREAEAQGKGLRLKLRVQAPALAGLPWEFLYDPREGEYLCLMSDRPVVRYIEAVQPVQPLEVTPPLRILGMIASPAGLTPLDVEQEKLRLTKATEKLQAQGLMEVTWLEGQTWRDLQRAMRSGPWHIFHFVGHGGFDPLRDEGLIVVADDAGGPQYLTATDLSRLLADHKPLRLALLNACEGARGGSQDIFSSTASILVRRGIPAVVAMQYPITDRAAVEFARSFYESLADGLPADAAVAEARKAISIAVADSAEWGTPVLFMRASDGRIFDIARTQPAAPKPATALPSAPQTGTPGTSAPASQASAPALSAATPQTAAPAPSAPAPAPVHPAAEPILTAQTPAAPQPPSKPRWLWPVLGGAIGLAAIIVALLIARGGGGSNARTTPTTTETRPAIALATGTLLPTDAPAPTATSTPATTPTATPSPDAGAPKLEAWSVSPTEVTEGEPVKIEWQVSQADSVVLEPFGTVENQGSLVDTPRKTTTYTLTASRAGNTARWTQEVIVQTKPVAAPKIKSFTVSPNAIVVGQTADVRLAWETEGADTVTIEPAIGAVGPTGTLDIPAPKSDVLYTLAARNAGGETRIQAPLKVEPPMCKTTSDTVNFRSGPGTVYDRSGSALANGAEVEPVAFSATGYPASSGQWVQGRNAGRLGWVSAQFLKCNLELSRLPAPAAGSVPPTPTPVPAPRIGYFRAIPGEIGQGACTVLEWGSLSNANRVSIDPSIGSVATSGRREICPSDTTTYTLKVSGSGGTVSASVKVTVYPKPAIAYFRATPATITAGACVTLEWGAASNATEVTLDPGIGGITAPGSRSVCPAATTTYRMTLVGQGGETTLSATVTVTPPTVTIAGRLTLVTGNNGTTNNPILELSGDFPGAPYRITLDQPNDLRPDQTDVYSFSVPAGFCAITGFSVSKPASPNREDDWYLKEIYLSLDGAQVYFDRVADRLLTSTGYPYGGSWTGTQDYKDKCGG